MTLHTGSRNPGNIIGKYWMARAKMDGENFNGLCMYKIDSELGQAYYNDMLWAFDYANSNRDAILKNTLSLMGLNIKDYRGEVINETHNHAVVTDKGVLHRKGATPAEKGVKGVIPGNMRDGVFITEGLGNEDYLSSCSHGAGRCMSRTKAKKSIDYQTVREEMSALGIIVDLTSKNIDEGPDAYKDIFEVVKKQEGVVIKVIDHFRPVIVHIG